MSGYQQSKNDWKPSTAIVRQDSRTSVHTTRAANETTNTTVTHTAGFDYNNRTLVLSRTKETVEYRQQAYITVKTSRRTPTPDELAELMQHVKMQETSERAFKRRSGAGSTANGGIETALSLKSTPKFKSHRNSGSTFKNFQYTSGGGNAAAGSARNSGGQTPTLAKIESSTLTQSDGRKVTTSREQQRVNLKEMWLNQQPTTATATTTPKTTTTSTSTQMSKYSSPSYMKPITSSFNTSLFMTPSSTVPTKATTNTGAAGTSSSWLTKSKPSTTATTTTKTTVDAIKTNHVPLTLSSLLSTTNSPYSAGSITTKSQFSAPFTTAASTTNYSIGYTSPYSRTKNESLTTRATAPSLSPATTTSKSSTYVSPYRTVTAPSTTQMSQSKSTSNLKDSKGYSLNSPPPTSEVNKKSNGVQKKKLKPGVVFIINNYKFNDENFKPRDGTEVDVVKLKQVFKKFKMECKVYTDPKKAKITEIGDKLRKSNFRDLACVVVVVLSHGNRHERAAAKDDLYCIDDELVFPMMQNDTLVGKHKILFLQLCKGDKEIENKQQTDSILISPPTKNYAPNELLKVYSTFEGYVSYRAADGSYFIQALCELLERDGMVKEIRDIINDVIILVKERSSHKQIPSCTTTFTTPFIFGDYVN